MIKFLFDILKYFFGAKNIFVKKLTSEGYGEFDEDKVV